MYVDRAVLTRSRHANVPCAGCHVGITRLPHASTLDRATWAPCHRNEAQAYAQSTHGRGLAKRDADVPTCQRCHGGHDIVAVKDPASRVQPLAQAKVCMECHADRRITSRHPEMPSVLVIRAYADSVHGQAVSKKGLAVAPTCTSCHGTHALTPADDPNPIWGQVVIWAGLFGLLGLVASGMRRTQEGPITVGDQVRDFTLTTFEGYSHEGQTQVSLAELKGKVVVVNFWASWCKPCEQEAAELEEAWRYYQPGGEVAFLGVDYVDTEPEPLAYLEKFDITYPNGPDLGTRISQRYRTTGVPEAYVIDKNGLLAYVKLSPFLSEQEIHSAIDPLLQP